MLVSLLIALTRFVKDFYKEKQIIASLLSPPSPPLLFYLNWGAEDLGWDILYDGNCIFVNLS